jgi:phosphoribosylaminoimidazole-succinocarboxamide synthase
MNANIQFDPNKLIKQGKTKNVYQGPGGNIVLEFTDRVTGDAASGEIDPGGNDRLGELKGKSELAYKMALHYFRLLQQRNLPTHFIDACDERRVLLARPSRMFGNGIEWIYRGVASGSFVRRYGMYIKEGAQRNRRPRPGISIQCRCRTCARDAPETGDVRRRRR